MRATQARATQRGGRSPLFVERSAPGNAKAAQRTPPGPRIGIMRSAGGAKGSAQIDTIAGTRMWAIVEDAAPRGCRRTRSRHQCVAFSHI